MHPRQRSPRGFYASDYRHPNNRPKSSSRRGGDIFVEAGRLAAEYLVSQGLLPPNVLSFKLNNHSFKKDDSSVRTSALARLGNADGRRKLGFDDFVQKGRRRGSFRSNVLDWGTREFRRNASWSDRFRTTNDDDTAIRHQDIEVVPADTLSHKPSNLNDNEDDLDAVVDKDPLLDSNPNSSAAGKDTYNVDVQVVKSSNELENESGGVKEVKDATCDDHAHKSSVSKNLSVQSSDQESNGSIRVFTDLLSLCKSAKVPTRARSVRTPKNLKNNSHHVVDLQGPQILAEDGSVKASSSGDLLSDKTYHLENLDSDIAKVEPVHDVENMKELDTACNAEEDQSIGSQSDQDRGYMHDNNHESSATLSDYGSCSSLAEERGEKRAAEADDVREETKRMREWLPSLVPRTEEYFLPNNPIGMKGSPGEDEISHIDKVNMTSEQGSLLSSSQFTEVGDRPFLPCSEEKQSLPNSFRTCDLNLIEASEVHESHADHPILIYPPVSETKKAVPVDIDLSMSHPTVSGKFNTHATNGKEIEVIDLENDSIQEEKPIGNMERKTDNMFPGLEGFSNHAPNTADIHDVQDGYGLMISELLGTDFPNCSSVPTDINSVHNEMGLHNGTGTLTEDDSIYMSLGEIPLSFLRPWEQPPPQDYQKPF